MLTLYENRVHSGVILSVFAYIFWMIHLALLVAAVPHFGFLWTLALGCGFSAIFIYVYALCAGVRIAVSSSTGIRGITGALLFMTLMSCAVYASLFTAGVFTLGSYFFLILYQREESRGNTSYMFAIYVALIIGFMHFFVHETHQFVLGSIAGVLFSLLNGITKSIGFKGALNDHPFSYSFFQCLFTTFLTVPFALLVHPLPSVEPFWWMVIVSSGFFLFLAHYYFQFSYQFARGITIGSIAFVGLVIAAFIQIGLWDQYPNFTQLFGALLVIVGSLALMREFAFRKS